MEAKTFKKIIQNCVLKYGFIYKNKNYYINDKLIVVINCQKSKYDNSYYINYGFWIKEIHEELSYPLVESCDIVGRFNCIIDKTLKFDFCLDALDEECLDNNLTRNIEDFIIPVLKYGITRYFEMYPKALYSAKKLLKDYMKLE